MKNRFTSLLLFKQNFLRVLLLVTVSTFSFGVKSQTIVNVSTNGAVSGTSAGIWVLDWISSSVSSSYVEKTIYVTYSGLSNASTKLIFDDTSVASEWEVLFGSDKANGWQKFCRATTIPTTSGTQQKTEQIKVRFNAGGKTGTFKNSISIGFGSGCGSFTAQVTFNTTVEVVSKGIYTWIGTSGVDSTWDRDNNWAPTRTSPATDDILLVDLGKQDSVATTSIDISGVTETIGQFKILPYNFVTFKCTTNAANLTVTGGLNGDDFDVDTFSTIRFSGPKSGESTSPSQLSLITTTGNQVDINGNLINHNGLIRFSGNGSHRVSANIQTYGGTLSFQPTSGLQTLILDGKSQTISRTTGTLYIDSNTNITAGPGITSTLTLQRSLPIISNLTLAANCTIASNTPTNYSTSANVNAFEPHLQLKATPKANSSAHGQILPIPSTSSVTGGVLFELYNNKQRAYRALGLPFSNGIIIPQFTDDIDVTGNVSGSNANEFTTTCSWCTHSLFSWNETTSAWSPYTSASSVTTIPHGSGMLVFFRGAKGNGLGDTTIVANDKVLSFKGTLAQQSYNFSLVQNGTGSLKGFNLIGNPYPCTIDLREVYESNTSTILPRFYLYDAISRRYNTWDSVGKGQNQAPSLDGTAVYKTTGNRNKTKLLAAGGAAFFVLNPQGTSTTLTFNESHKFSGARSTTKHFSSGVQEETSTDCNVLRSEIRFQDNIQPESDGFTLEFDQENMNPDGDLFDVTKMWAYLAYGPITDNNSWLTIDRRDKIANPGESKSIPLKVAYPKDASTAMEISFDYCPSSNYKYNVKLVDKLNQTTTTIEDGTTYKFNAANSDEKKSDRFELVFTGIEQNSNNTLLKNDAVIYPNPAKDRLNIISNSVKSIQIINNLGQIVLTDSNPQSMLTVMNIDSLQNGIYFVKILSDNSSQTSTFIKQ